MTNQLRWTLTTALLLSTASLSTCASVDLAKIHEHMTDAELSATFNVKDRASVPNYEVVPIVYQPSEPHRQRRSVQPGHHVVTIKNLTLYLEPVEHVLIGEDTPVYKGYFDKSYTDGIQYEQIENAWPKSLSMYQDPKNNAALVMFKESDGKVNIEGLIGDDTVVKPVPSRFKNSTSSMRHIVYTDGSFKKLSPESFFDNSYWSEKPRSLQSKQNQSKVDVVYPETLVIADLSTYLAHNKDLQALCKYIAVFWNAVDLRFRSLENPKVRLNIAGLIVPTDVYGNYYINVGLHQKNYLNATKTHFSIGMYLQSEKRFAKETYDIVVAMTNLDLCSFGNGGTDTVCDPNILGEARRGGACQHGENNFEYGIAVIEDHAKFDGILTAAHEIGHLFYADHDYAFVERWQQCNWDFGYLMSPSMVGSSNKMLWSDCSMVLMSHFLRSSKAECLYNKPIVKKPIAKVLPGQLMSKDEQCKLMEHDLVACEDERDDECRMLYCQKPKNWLSWLTFWLKRECISTRRGTFEGSPCSGGGTCLDGVCVHVDKKINEV